MYVRRSSAIAVALLSVVFDAAGAPSAPATGPTPSEPVPPTTSTPPSAAPPEPEPEPPAVDTDEPPPPPRRRRARFSGDSGAFKIPDPPSVPRGSVELRAGFAFGGDTLVRATLSNGEDRTLDAGKGGVVAIEGAVTPFWLGDIVGFGARLQVGLKYGSIDASNGSVSLIRWPLLLGVHTLIRFTDVAYVRLGANIETHAGLSLSASGDAGSGSADLDSSLGVGGELSLFFRQGPHFCYDVALQYAHIQYSAGGESVDASNGGFTAGIGYAF